MSTTSISSPRSMRSAAAWPALPTPMIAERMPTKAPRRIGGVTLMNSLVMGLGVAIGFVIAEWPMVERVSAPFLAALKDALVRNLDALSGKPVRELVDARKAAEAALDHAVDHRGQRGRGRRASSTAPRAPCACTC